MVSEPSVLVGEPETQAACRNCETELSGRYCSQCGQKDKHHDPSLHDLMHEFVHEFLHLDGKIVATMKALVLKPGSLSAEFLAGRRARFIGPVRLYLTLSLIFFLVAAYSPQQKEAIRSKAEKDQVQLEINKAEGKAGEKGGRIAKTVSKAIEDPELFRHAFLSNVSRVMFVIVPLFALGLRVAYRNRKRRYPSFVYFSLHYHAFVFLVLTVYWLAGMTKLEILESIVGFAVLVCIPVYLFMAMRRVFGGSRVRTALRMAVLGAFYLPCFGLGVGVAGVVTLMML